MGWMDKKQEDEITEMDAKDEAQPQQPEAKELEAPKQAEAKQPEKQDGPEAKDDGEEKMQSRKSPAKVINRYHNYSSKVNKKKKELALLEQRIKDLEKLDNAPSPKKKGRPSRR